MTAASVLFLQLGELFLDLTDTDTNGFIIKTVDLGFPAPRVVANDMPGQDGSDDQTAFFSTRVVQLTGSIVPTAAGASRSLVFDSLAPFISPGARPTLTYAMDADVAERCLDLRVSQWSNPIDHPENATAFSVQWVCPNPIAYEQTVNEVDIPFATGSSAGRSYPRTYPLTYPGSSFVGGDATVTDDGNYASWPTLRIFGPCTDPGVYWLDPVTSENLGIQVVFSGLTIASGDYVEVDTLNKTARLNGDPASNQYSLIDFANTSWGPLQPGGNLIRFAPVTASAPSICEVLWRNSFLN
jgi:hypothetical protein